MTFPWLFLKLFLKRGCFGQLVGPRVRNIDALYFSSPPAQVALVVKITPCNAGNLKDAGSIPRLGRSPAEGNNNPLQYSCLENPKDRGTWQATVHGFTKSGTRLK